MTKTVTRALISLLAFAIAVPAFASTVVAPTPPPSSGSNVVGAIFQNTGPALSAHAVQYGQAFAQGDFIGSGISTTVNGSSAPAQIDVKTRYGDGSARFGVITVLSPALGANASAPVTIAKSSSAGTPLSLSSMAGYSFAVTITVSGKTYTFDAASLLASALASGKVTYWCQGPVVTEGRIDVPVASSMHLIFDISKYSDGSYSTDVQFDNDYAMQSTGGTLTYTASITQNGSNVYSGSLTQYQYQQWHKEFWTNGAPTVNVQHDMPYLIKSGAILNYDLASGVDSSSISPATYSPLSSAGIATYMPTTGDRGDIGLTTQMNGNWILSQDATAAASAQAQADGAGSVPWHYFDPATGTYLSLDKYPTLWADGRGNPALTQATADPDWTTDNAHQPDLSFVPYLMTGSRWHLDQLNAQATFNEFVEWNSFRQDGKGLLINFFDQPRAQGWSFRQLAEAAWANPDGSADKSYWTRIVGNNLTNFIHNFSTLQAQQGQIYGYISGDSRGSSGSTVVLVPWSEDYATMAIAEAASLGFSDAVTVLNWMANWSTGRFLTPGLNPLIGTNYVNTIQIPATWASIQSSNTPDPLSSCSGCDYGQEALSALASIYNTTGNVASLQAYNALLPLHPNYPDLSSLQKSYVTYEAKIHIVPKPGVIALPPATTDPAASPSTKFTTGERVQVTQSLNVRSMPSTSGTPLGTQAAGVTGTVISGPTAANGYNWWQVNYDSRADGWSAEGWLVAAPAEMSSLATTTAADSAASTLASGNTLKVGLNEQYKLPSQAAAAAGNGATILIDAGTYTDDFAAWPQNNLTIRGVGGKARLVQDSKATPPNGKAIWVIDGSDVSISNIEFSGASVADANGAGIRAEGGGTLTIANSYFHDNQNGLLAAPNPAAKIVITNSEFANNGIGGDGHTHNMYIGNIASFTLEYSYSHNQNVGHLVKSRANKNYILYNRLTGETGTDSYELDLPNGGESYVIGNLLEKGPNSDNHGNLFAYAAEGATNATQKLYVVNNTFVNDYGGSPNFIWVTGSATGVIMNNLFVGAGTAISGGSLTASHNVSTTNPGFVNQASFDYRLVSGSPAIDAGADAGSANSMNLNAVMQYVHLASSAARSASGAIDAGAYEFGGTATQLKPTVSLLASVPSIIAGQSSTLSWNSANATSCTGTGFSTGNATSGSVSVSPTAATTYSISCNGAGDTASANSAIAVASAAQPSASQTGLTLHVSGDNNPLFSVTVDGKNIGTQTVTASYGDGVWQDITFAGDFSGAKQVDVQFLNDDDSVKGPDINLYVKSLTLNGITYQAKDAIYNRENFTGFIPGTGTENLYWNGVLRFSVNGTVAILARIASLLASVGALQALMKW